MRTIEKYKMLEKGDGVVIGVSGGPDSLCLLHLLYNLKDEMGLSLYVAHVNHKIRGEEAEDDALFVERICADWGIPFYLKEVDIPFLSKKYGMSSEELGRKARYEFFYDVMREVRANRIAVAQNLNDQAETVLMRLIRGTGIRGLLGIPPVIGNVIRPLIEVSREEIEEYLRVHGLEPRMDSTNCQPIYTRNKIRLELIPYLIREFNPNIIETISRIAEILREDEDFMETEAEKLLKKVVSFSPGRAEVNIEPFSEIHIALKRRVLRDIIKRLTGDIFGFEFRHINMMLDFFINSDTGESLDLPKNLKMLREYHKMMIYNKDLEEKSFSFSYPLNIPGDTYIPELGAKIEACIFSIDRLSSIEINTFSQVFDYEKIGGRLYVRSRRPGDFIRPSGMKGTKKLKEFFIDEKIPKIKRNKIPLIAVENEIVWIIGKRISESFRVDENTREILHIKYEKGAKDNDKD